jgi:hypothetical protein
MCMYAHINMPKPLLHVRALNSPSVPHKRIRPIIGQLSLVEFDLQE